LKKYREEIDESGDGMEDLDAIEDDTERSKALKKRLDSDRKKSQRLKEAQDKAELKEQERLARLSEKGSRKSRRRATPVETQGTVSLNKSPTVDSGTPCHSMQTRGTKRASSYDVLVQTPVLDYTQDDDNFSDEFFLNSSLNDVLGGDSGQLPQSYSDLKAFLASVSTILHSSMSAPAFVYCIPFLFCL